MNRLDRINQQLKREISKIIQQDLSDPRLEFVSVTHADVSRDLRNARVYFSVFGNNTKYEDIQITLQGARGMIRKLIGQRMKMRYTPELVFSYDESIEMSARIDKTLKELK